MSTTTAQKGTKGQAASAPAAAPAAAAPAASTSQAAAPAQAAKAAPAPKKKLALKAFGDAAMKRLGGKYSMVTSQTRVRLSHPDVAKVIGREKQVVFGFAWKGATLLVSSPLWEKAGLKVGDFKRVSGYDIREFSSPEPDKVASEIATVAKKAGL